MASGRSCQRMVGYMVYLAVVMVVLDVVVLHGCLGFGYPRHFEEENVQRWAAPYVEFTGRPGAADHNEYGFRGASLKEAAPGDLKVAFFGGSTGYHGQPPIPNVVEKELERRLGVGVFVANYSVVSSNHRQHLHGIIEFLPEFEPDVVIFYGGFNETFQSALYDPRPGYPYNWFYRAECSPLVKLLLENSAIAGEIDKRWGVLSGLGKLREEEAVLSEGWNERIVDKYFETLMLAERVSGSIGARFFAFYQPYQVPGEFQATHEEMRDRMGSISYGFDVSGEYDGLEVYRDILHVNQAAREVMGRRIGEIVAGELGCQRIRGTD